MPAVGRWVHVENNPIPWPQSLLGWTGVETDFSAHNQRLMDRKQLSCRQRVNNSKVRAALLSCTEQTQALQLFLPPTQVYFPLQEVNPFLFLWQPPATKAWFANPNQWLSAPFADAPLTSLQKIIFPHPFISVLGSSEAWKGWTDGWDSKWDEEMAAAPSAWSHFTWGWGQDNCPFCVPFPPRLRGHPRESVSGVRAQPNGSQYVRSTWVPSLLNSIFLQGSRESKKEKPLPASIASPNGWVRRDIEDNSFSWCSMLPWKRKGFLHGVGGKENEQSILEDVKQGKQWMWLAAPVTTWFIQSSGF